MKLIDTHAHLTFEGLVENIDDVLARSAENDIEKIITVATEPAEFKKNYELAKNNPQIYTAIGIHPHYAKDVVDDDIEAMEKYFVDAKVVAVGETGLDFHYNFSKQHAQVMLFETQLELAAKYDLPVIVHCRNAFEQTVEILDKFAGRLKNVVFHCYSGTAGQTQQLLDKGYYISFTGIVTFKNAELAREAALTVPVERMMLETDCPYMSPVPMRKQKINEPALMKHTAEFIAQLKQMDIEEFADAVWQTSTSFFGID